MAKLICLLLLALAACMVAGFPHQDVNKMLHRTARAADPSPQFFGFGDFGHDYHNHGHGHYNHGHGYHGYEHYPHGHHHSHDFGHGYHGYGHYPYDHGSYDDYNHNY